MHNIPQDTDTPKGMAPRVKYGTMLILCHMEHIHRIIHALPRDQGPIIVVRETADLDIPLDQLKEVSFPFHAPVEIPRLEPVMLKSYHPDLPDESMSPKDFYYTKHKRGRRR